MLKQNAILHQQAEAIKDYLDVVPLGQLSLTAQHSSVTGKLDVPLEAEAVDFSNESYFQFPGGK